MLPRAGGAPRLLLSCFIVLSACSVGGGEGEIAGNLNIRDCAKASGAYELKPTFFAAESAEELLNIRIQRGSAFPNVSDGLNILVRDATEVAQAGLNQALVVSDAPEITVGAAVRVTLYLNRSCPREPDEAPVVLKAVSGSVTFQAIYAPEVARDEVEINANLGAIRFLDDREAELGNAELSGRFRFLYNRGKPAQPFP